MDQKSRLDSQKAMRDRLQALLAKAETVEEILKVEEQLSRIQTEIDAAEARFRTLSTLTNQATVTVELDRRTILGPLGYLFGGLAFVGEKLFVIQK